MPKVFVRGCALLASVCLLIACSREQAAAPGATGGSPPTTAAAMKPASNPKELTYDLVKQSLVANSILPKEQTAQIQIGKLAGTAGHGVESILDGTGPMLASLVTDGSLKAAPVGEPENRPWDASGNRTQYFMVTVAPGMEKFVLKNTPMTDGTVTLEVHSCDLVLKEVTGIKTGSDKTNALAEVKVGYANATPFRAAHFRCRDEMGPSNDKLWHVGFELWDTGWPLSPNQSF